MRAVLRRFSPPVIGNPFGLNIIERIPAMKLVPMSERTFYTRWRMLKRTRGSHCDAPRHSPDLSAVVERMELPVAFKHGI